MAVEVAEGTMVCRAHAAVEYKKSVRIRIALISLLDKVDWKIAHIYTHTHVQSLLTINIDKRHFVFSLYEMKSLLSCYCVSSLKYWFIKRYCYVIIEGLDLSLFCIFKIITK